MMLREEENYLHDILKQFQVDYNRIESYGTGLINRTWKVYTPSENYILQRINEFVFKRPQDIDYNIRLIDEYLQVHHPEYFFAGPARTGAGETIYFDQEHGWFRLSPFVENSVTLTVVETPEQAYEAAAQFGKFTKTLSGMDATQLRFTIPDFHNLKLRFLQFKQALQDGDAGRKVESEEIIGQLLSRESIVSEYEKRQKNPAFRTRVIHHDTKISNVLFDEKYQGICVIDLDTVMPGYFFSDVGDMMRTYLSPVGEEDQDFSNVIVRKEFYDAIVAGYKDQMGEELTSDEHASFIFSGRFMVYMQALRFLTDYLNKDIYYGARYPKHNFMRAGNQLKLLQEIEQLDR